jgi:hypothetical protein
MPSHDIVLRDAINNNLEYQRQRVKDAQYVLNGDDILDDPEEYKDWAQEHRDAQASFLAVLAVAREAGLR